MLRADWLSHAVTVAYVPALGPVHPDSDLAALFDAVHQVEPGSFLPYDKQQRWADRKDEIVLPGYTGHSSEHTRVVTLSCRHGGRLRLHHYTDDAWFDLAEARDTAGKLAAEHGVQTALVVWFQHATPSSDVHAARVWLAPTSGDVGPGGPPVIDLDDCPPRVRATFAQFCAASGDPGMATLGRHQVRGRLGGPLLVTVEDGRIVGAIGPMQTLPDPAGVPRLLPQYFAVLRRHRRGARGRALWRAAQRWGHAAGARYQLMQAAVDGPADRLYRAEGAQPLGIVCTAAA